MFSNLKNKIHENPANKKHIRHSASFRWEDKFNEVTHFWGTNKEGDLATWEDLWKCCFQWSKASCLVLFTCFQWIMYLQWFMVRHAQASSSPSTWNPTWIFPRKPTGKTKIAQFKEVIKTVRNQYLSLEGPWWGFSISPSPHPAPCLALCVPALLTDSCSAPSNKPERGASCSNSGPKWHVMNNQKAVTRGAAQHMLRKFRWPICRSMCSVYLLQDNESFIIYLV